jgi:Peptidase U49.
MINNFSEKHEGNMPIRVLQYNLIHQFETLNSDFLELTKNLMKKIGLDNGIGYKIDEEEIKVPFVIFNKINLQETFLSYVWCISYSISVLHDEVVVKQSKNDYYKNNNEVINDELVSKAKEVWVYAMSLIKNYSEWSLELPNPERYLPEDAVIIERTNGLYLSAMKFILAHEFAHIELEHATIADDNVDPNALSIRLEREADRRAFELNLAGITEENRVTVIMGILTGLCSILFFKSTTREEAYPDVDERIDSIIEIVNPEPQDPMWSFATLAYRLWDEYYTTGLIWIAGLESPRELYYSVKEQVKRNY